MRQVLNKSMIVMAAASGIITAVGGHAYADASADGAAVNSPGVGSGNVAQVPVHVPVNACGNTVDAVGLLNPAFGNECQNVDSHKAPHAQGHKSDDKASTEAYGDHGQNSDESRSADKADEGYGDDGYGDDGYGSGGASADGVASNSPGVLSGNLIQAPVHVPVNVCGNSVNVIGLLNAAAENECVNETGYDHPPVDEPVEPPTAAEPPAKETPAEPPATPAPNAPVAQLAHTGAGDIGMAAGASAALLLGGAVLMRRTRGSRR
ncbi:chaplin [Streptomyces sp. NPDC102451]|uniref:chaplin n=1 Tax=Streptomyces sp. NPDC102451 TaxID=3366177 RepID=UPI00380B9321